MDRLICLLQSGGDNSSAVYGMIEHEGGLDDHLTLCFGDGLSHLDGMGQFRTRDTVITLDIQGIRVLKKLLADAQKLWG